MTGFALRIWLCAATFIGLSALCRAEAPYTCDPNLQFWMSGGVDIRDETGHITIKPGAYSGDQVVCGLKARGREDVCNFTGNNYLLLDDAGVKEWLPRGRSPRTMCAWVSARNLITAVDTIFAVSYGFPADDREFFIANTYNRIYVGAFNDDYDTGIDWFRYLNGTWMHICVTWENGTGAVYLNGGYRLTDSLTGGGYMYDELNFTKPNWNVEPFVPSGVIGGQLNNPGTPIYLWDGFISDVRIYNKSMTFTEIHEIYEWTRGNQRNTSCYMMECEPALKMWVSGSTLSDGARPEQQLMKTPNGTVTAGTTYMGVYDTLTFGSSSWIELYNSFIAANLPASALPRSFCVYANHNNVGTQGTFFAYGDPAGPTMPGGFARPAMYVAKTAGDLPEGNVLDSHIWDSLAIQYGSNQWTQFCLVYDGNSTFGGTNSAIYYVGGSQQIKRSPTNTYNNAATNFFGRLGAYLGTPPNLLFVGAMADIRFYSRALSWAEVQRLQQQVEPPTRKRYCDQIVCPAGLVLWISGGPGRPDKSPSNIAIPGITDYQCGLTSRYMRWGCRWKVQAQLNQAAINTNFPKGNSDRSYCMAYYRGCVAGGDDYYLSYGSGTSGMSWVISQTAYFGAIGPDGTSHIMPGYGACSEWSHVCHVYTPGTSKLYWNGQMVSNVSKTWSIPTNTLDAWFGYPFNNQAYIYQPLAQTADIRLYNIALTDYQVYALYETLLGSETIGGVGYVVGPGFNRPTSCI